MSCIDLLDYSERIDFYVLLWLKSMSLGVGLACICLESVLLDVLNIYDWFWLSLILPRSIHIFYSSYLSFEGASDSASVWPCFEPIRFLRKYLFCATSSASFGRHLCSNRDTALCRMLMRLYAAPGTWPGTWFLWLSCSGRYSARQLVGTLSVWSYTYSSVSSIRSLSVSPAPAP